MDASYKRRQAELERLSTAEAEARRQHRRADGAQEDYEIALQTTSEIIEIVNRNLPNGGLSSGVAQTLLKSAEKVVGQIARRVYHPPASLQSRNRQLCFGLWLWNSS